MEHVENEETTTWLNDSDKTVSFKLLTHRKVGNTNNGSVYKNVVLKPGQKITLSSEYDAAIRQVGDGDRVVGGLCPWLKKDGEESVNLDKSLDYIAAEKEIELQNLAAQLRKEHDLKEAVAIQAANEKKPGKVKAAQ